MDEAIIEFRNDMFRDIENLSILNHSDETTEFINKYVEVLKDSEEILEFEPCDVEYVGKKKRKARIDGYSYEEFDQTLSLYIANFTYSNEVQTITNTIIEDCKNKVLNFVEFSFNQDIIKNSEESSELYQISQFLYERKNFIKKIKIYIFTDSNLSKMVKYLPEGEYQDIKIDLSVWDINRIYNIVASSFEKEDLIINVEDFGVSGIKCVEAMKSELEKYTSYLAVINGELLANLYIKYGSRLLEGNVRSFLSVRGKINKEIRNTIRNKPEIFFAYNNGIAATVSELDIVIENNERVIKGLTNFQIINGGQTTASIANAVLQDKLDENVKKINVPLKITIVDKEKAEEMIPNIARYANSQNKVDESDFFSNHPFHVKFKELSNKNYAPAAKGIPFQTIWFYERAKGEYTQEQMKKTPAEKRSFLNINPKNQLIRKIDLAKYLMTYYCKPYIVSRGNQFNMREFAGEIEKVWNKGSENEEINQYFYRKCIALAIIFKETEKIVSNASWYNKSYRANIVTYSISILFNYIKNKQKNMDLDFMRIWNEQDLYTELRSQLETTTFEVFNYINRDDRAILNVTEWCKKKECWDKTFEVKWEINDRFISSLINQDLNDNIKKESRKDQKLENQMDTINYLITKGSNYWSKMFAWGTKRRVLTDLDVSYLKIMINNRIPTEKQGSSIKKLEEKLINEGFVDEDQ